MRNKCIKKKCVGKDVVVIHDAQKEINNRLEHREYTRVFMEYIEKGYDYKRACYHATVAYSCALVKKGYFL